MFRGCADTLLPIWILFAQFDQSFSRAKDLIWQNDLFADSMIAAGLTGTGTGTKLYVSNLDSGVSNEDIKVQGLPNIYVFLLMLCFVYLELIISHNCLDLKFLGIIF